MRAMGVAKQELNQCQKRQLTPTRRYAEGAGCLAASRVERTWESSFSRV